MKRFKVGELVKTVSLKDNKTPLYGMIITKEGRIWFTDGTYRSSQSTHEHLDILEYLSVAEDDAELVECKNTIVRELENERKLFDAAKKKRLKAEELMKEANELEACVHKSHKVAFDCLKAFSLEMKKRESEIAFERLLAKEREACDGTETLKMSFYDGTLNIPRAIAVIEKTARPIFYRYGFAYRGAEKRSVSKEEAIKYVKNGSMTDVDADDEKIVVNQYSSNDMY